ncbi:hypothetical protein CRENPOLYSF1_1590004 [Crenothrix polyspora]|uniref:Uncharacterized protein n=1 Tax=Crenothrix polyspora TaxID=360316 RepID=A0A1R4H3S0_9GAMM|nr:hypothetical protein CRENPOLYSF1_1590004 [Crenothrix polyspora]
MDKIKRCSPNGREYLASTNLLDWVTIRDDGGRSFFLSLAMPKPLENAVNLHKNK